MMREEQNIRYTKQNDVSIFHKRKLKFVNNITKLLRNESEKQNMDLQSCIVIYSGGGSIHTDKTMCLKGTA